MIDEEHLVDIVDENDNVVGVETKSVKFEKELISRNVVAFLKNSEGKYIVVRRAANKKNFPNLLDISVCGHVNHGESYEEAIIRETEEELGVRVKNLEFLRKILHENKVQGKRVRFYTGIFSGEAMGEISTACEEFSEYKLFDLKELTDIVKDSPESFTPFFVNDFNTIKAFLD